MLAALRERAIAYLTTVAVLLWLLRWVMPDFIIDLMTLAMVPLAAWVASPTAPGWLGRLNGDR